MHARVTRSRIFRGRLRVSSFGAVALMSVVIQACAPTDDGAARSTQTASSAPKLVLIIGDGMGDQQVTIARNYLVGADGRLTLDRMPFRGAVQVQAVSETNPDLPVYVSDSADTATAMATGVVTSRGRIATTAGTDMDLPTIVELAEAGGIRTGIVTTASVTDATPAAFVAHVNQRYCQGPRNMKMYLRALELDVDCTQDYKANGGPGSISEQIAASGVDIVLGGGMRYFDQPTEDDPSTTVAAAATASGFRLIDTAAELTGLDGSGRILGLFAPNTMPVQWRGEGDAEAVPIERVDGEIRLPEPFGCEANPAFEGTPRLAQMTRAALDQLQGDGGFLLIVESASIDKQSHDRRPCGHIGELAQLDEALALVLDYARQHPELLVLVTADHSHAAQIVTATGGYIGTQYATPGRFARIRTPEGAIMGINYATSDSPTQEYHTGAEVPLYAAGGGADELPPFLAQHELFDIMKTHLGLD